MSLIATSIPIINPYNFNIAPIVLNSNLNTRPITYPVDVSSLTYGIDLFIEAWEEQKYMPCQTWLGKVFNYITGLEKDDNGNPYPSIFGRIANLFSKSKAKEIIKEKLSENDSTSTPQGEVVDYEINSNGNVTGTFQVSYMQLGCESSSFVNGNWTMIFELDVPKSIENDENTFYDSVENCLINSMLSDYFRSVAYFCDGTTICGCPQDQHFFSYIYQNNVSSLKIFNTDMVATETLEIGQYYPAPNLEIINFCYDDSLNQIIHDQQERSVLIATIAYITVFTLTFSTTFICIFTCCPDGEKKAWILTQCRKEKTKSLKPLKISNGEKQRIKT